jgi:progesterone-induced-blocking factor 1
MRESKSEVERRNESLRREIDILTQDKAFLSREAQNHEEKSKRLEERLDRTELALLDAKKQAEKYMDRVLSANDEVKSKFDTQFTKEIDDLKDRQTKELSLAKQNLTDLYERKVEYLTERKDE